MEKQLAIIRLRGRTGINKNIALTLELMKLQRVNTCIIAKESPELLGMLKKAKDYITWGVIDEASLKIALEKRKGVELNGGRILLRLHPARGGLGSRGIKAAFTNSGALGDRKDKIAELLKKMI